jgi:hypothetical protein
MRRPPAAEEEAEEGFWEGARVGIRVRAGGGTESTAEEEEAGQEAASKDC